MANWLTGKVLDNTHWTDWLFTLTVDAPVKTFRAGQFVSLALEIDGEEAAKPYTFINAPDSTPLEFFCYRNDEGRLSPALQALQPGDEVRVKEQPAGFFVLDEVPASRDLWLFGTGAGIAPYLSILQTAQPWEEHRQVVLVQAVRAPADLLYQDRIGAVAAQYGERFVHLPVTSREVRPGGLQGRIPALLEDGTLEEAAGLELSLDDSQIMLCGNPHMIDEAMAVLKARGFRKNRRRTPGQITTEKYW